MATDTLTLTRDDVERLCRVVGMDDVAAGLFWKHAKAIAQERGPEPASMAEILKPRPEGMNGA